MLLCKACENLYLVDESTLNTLTSIFYGLVSNLIFAICIWIIQQIRYFVNIDANINDKIYRVSYKRYQEEELFIIKCKTSKNVIKFKGTTTDNSNFYGEIILNIINLKVGEGYHVQDGGAFAFNKVVISDSGKTIYVEAHYTKVYKYIIEDEKEIEIFDNDIPNTPVEKIKIKSKIIPQAFVWERID